MHDEQLRSLTETRVHAPQSIAQAAGRRLRPTSLVGETGRLLVIAADHPARGALRAGVRPMAMGDRADLLDRLCTALARPGVNGVLGTPDILDDLLMLGALENVVVIGSMNRGGILGSSFELDDRFTAFDADAIKAAGYQGGKMLLRIDPDDPGTVATLESCGRAVSALARHGLMAMIEPFMAHRVDDGLRNQLTEEAMIRAINIASGLGVTSAYTWLKVPVADNMEPVMAATTLPALLLGGEVSPEQEETFLKWSKALALPNVKGLAVGRSLLYPPDDDVAGAVDAVVGLL